MILEKEIKFLNQCKKNKSKLNFYLDMSNSNISCGPCLTLKSYYKWCIKFLFKAELENETEEGFFKRIIDKLDYKVIGNMEYEDIKDITAAYYSLGEIYYNQGNIESSKVYFTKVIDVMEEFLKTGNRFQTQEVQRKNGIVLFEILMWARKSLGDIVEPEEALGLYDSIIAEEELLYLEKYNGTLVAAKKLRNVDKVNEAVRSIIKIMADYEEANKVAVEFLIEAEDYTNAIDIITDEYSREGINHWINIINTVCVVAKELNEECTQKIINFADILMEELKIVEWSNLMLTLYRSIKKYKNQVILQLNYIKHIFTKVDYIHNDFINYSDALLVLNDIYEDIRKEKYHKKYLREYEFDFTFFLLNVATANNSAEKGIEAATKLSALIEISKDNKKLYDYINNCKDKCIKDIKTEKYSLQGYPWYYLYKEIDEICQGYGAEANISRNCKLKNSLDKMIVGINTISNKELENTLNDIVGEELFLDNMDFILMSNEELNISCEEKNTYEFKVIKSNLITSKHSIIMTSTKEATIDIPDKNVVLINGHEELRDIDITYIKHIVSKGNDTRVMMIVNSEKTEYSLETINYNNTIMESIVNDNGYDRVIDISKLKESKELFNIIIGEEPEKIIPYRFYTFKESIEDKLLAIDNHLKKSNETYKKEIYSLNEAIEEYENLIEDSNTNCKEFILKVKGDIEFLGTYAAEKMALMIPDVIEKNLNNIDELEDVSSLKNSAEKVFSEAIISWCNKNIYSLLLEQFQVYVSRYSTYYGYHQETLEKLMRNRENILGVNKDFSQFINEFEVKTFEEIMKEIFEVYNQCLDEIDYKVTVIPNDKFINTVTDGIKVMFMKSEAKAETSRVKIKNQVVENKENIAAILGQAVQEKLRNLQNTIVANLESIFNTVNESMKIEEEETKNYVRSMEKKHEIAASNNEKLYLTINLLRAEVLKFNKQIDENFVYHYNKCYQL